MTKSTHLNGSLDNYLSNYFNCLQTKFMQNGKYYWSSTWSNAFTIFWEGQSNTSLSKLVLTENFEADLNFVDYQTKQLIENLQDDDGEELSLETLNLNYNYLQYYLSKEKYFDIKSKYKNHPFSEWSINEIVCSAGFFLGDYLITLEKNKTLYEKTIILSVFYKKSFTFLTNNPYRFVFYYYLKETKLFLVEKENCKTMFSDYLSHIHTTPVQGETQDDFLNYIFLSWNLIDLPVDALNEIISLKNKTFYEKVILISKYNELN